MDKTNESFLRPFNGTAFGNAHDPDGLACAVADRIETGWAVCEPTGRLIRANRAAAREFAHGGAFTLAHGVLRCRAPFQEAVDAALRGAACKCRTQLVLVGAHDRRLPLVVMPLRHGDADEAAALLVFGRRTACSATGLDLLARRFALTLAEQRVLGALTADRTACQIAAAHGVAISTVRTQIQSIRDKVGARTVEALLLLAAQMPPIACWPEQCVELEIDLWPQACAGPGHRNAAVGRPMHAATTAVSFDSS